MTTTAAHASIIIPVFNQLHHTKACLESLLTDGDRPPYQVIVIDNASSDGTGEYLAALSAKLKASQTGASAGTADTLVVISNPTNRGVAPAWNQGLQASTGELIAILNNDILLTPGWLKNCAWALERHRLALVSPFAGTGVLNYNLQAHAEQFTAKNKKSLWRTYDFCAVVLPRSTYTQIGLFDEGFLVGGYEDTDYAYRLKAVGLKFAVTGAAYIHHFGSQTLGEFKKRGDQHAAHNKAYFISKWGKDPSHFAGTWRGKALKTWRKIKLAAGYM